MADNLKQIEQDIDTYIDPNGEPASILAENHNAIEKSIVRKAGKYVGSAYTAVKNATVFTSGVFSWQGNAMNNTADFTIRVAKKTADLNDFGVLLDTLTENDIIQFKDYVGRCVLLKFISYSAGTDGGGNPIYDIVVSGYVDNPNYTYQINENETCILSLIKQLISGGGFLPTGGYDGTGQDLKNEIEVINTELLSKADLVGGLVPSYQLPAYVDDILEGYLLSNVFYSDSGHTTVIPAEAGKIYVDITAGQKNRQYRYSGSTYIQITNGLIASTADVPEDSGFLYFTTARVLSWVLDFLFPNIPAKPTTLVDADLILAGDSADSFKTKTRTFAQLKATLLAYIDTLFSRTSNQISVSLPATVSDSWHGKTVKFTSTGLLTVPSSFTNAAMTFEGVTKTGVTLSWAITSPKTFEFGTPVSVTEKQIFTFMQNDGLDTIMILGI